MSTSATTITAPGALADARPAAGDRSVRRTRSQLAIAVGSLVVIFGISLFVVLLAANRPSFLVPTTHVGFYPHWLAGPLGGLLPFFPRGSNALKYVFTLGMVVMYVAYVLALDHAPRLRARWVIGAIVAVQLVMVLSPPLSLTDLFNYINYGRLEVVHHLNPYATIPYYEPHSDPSYYLSNWHHLLSPYGPLFTVLTFALVPLGVVASFWVLKVLLMLASLGTLALVWACARLLGRDPLRAIVFVGLNPLVLLWGMGGDHNDFLMMLLIVGAFYLLLRARSLRAPGPQAPEMPVAAPIATPGAVGAVTAPAGTVAAAGAAAGVRRLGAGRIRRLGLATLRAGRPGPNGAGPSASGNGAGPAGAAAPVAPAAGVGAAAGAAVRRSPRRSAADLAGRAGALVWPLAPLDAAAGVLLVTAVAIKASAGILLPVVLMALLVRPRDLVQVLIGVVLAALALGAMTYLAFGAHIPDLSTQARLVTSVSIPNLVGLATGQGGETDVIRSVMTGVLVVGVLASAWWASRHRDLGPDALVTGAGWASVVLIVSLSWVLPWYVLWTLPLAVLSRSRALRRTVLVLGAYLIFAWMPLQADLFRTIGFHPLGTPLGAVHQRETKALLH